MVIGKRFVVPLNSSAIFVSLDNMPPSTCCRTESSPEAKRLNSASICKFYQHSVQQKDCRTRADGGCESSCQLGSTGEGVI